MANLGDSVGEGAENDLGGAFVNTGYGTYAGTGNVDSGAKEQKGTGYDAHGQVKTSFGKWHIDYDPVTGQATTGTTCDYHFPGQAMDLEAVTGGVATGNDSGGLTDVSAAPVGHATLAETRVEKDKL